MSISTDIAKALSDVVSTVRVNKSDLHGQRATEVIVSLIDGKTVTGTFINEATPGFGGVVFDHKKDIVGLMVSKVNSVLEGTAE